MADSTPPAPDSGDAPFDLDFDIGDIEFDEPEAPAVAPEPADNALSRDLESLLGAPETPQENLAKAPEPAPAPTPEPTHSSEPAPLIDDEFDIEDDLEEEIEPPEPKAKLPEPKVEIPEPKAAAPLVAPAPEPAAEELDEITADLDEDDSLSAAALAAAARRKQRRQATVATEHSIDEDDELTAILEDDLEDAPAKTAVPPFAPRSAEPEKSAPDPIDDLDEELTVDLEEELPPAAVVPRKVETVTDDLDDELTVDLEDELPPAAVVPRKVETVTDDLDDELTVDLEDELPPAAVVPRKVETVTDDLDDELTVDLEDELPPVVAQPAEIEAVAEDLEDEPTVDLEDELPPVEALPAKTEAVADNLEDELTIDLEDELPAPKVAEVSVDLEDELTVDLEDELPDPEVSTVADELDVELEDELPPMEALEPEVEELEAPASDPLDALTDEASAEESPTGEAKPAALSDFEADEMEAAAEQDANAVEVTKKVGTNLRSLRLFEWAGIAAVLFACLCALFMLAGVVRATISDAQEGSAEIRKAIPREASGTMVSASDLEAYWRDRTETDRAKEGHIILPVVGASSVEGSGILQFLFRDGRGDIRGDGHSFKIEGGRVVDLGNGQEIPTDGSIGAFATEGMQTEVQYAGYRDEWDDIAPERWSIEVRESSDGKEWQSIVQFEIPAERR